jgi:hypothetical protein
MSDSADYRCLRPIRKEMAAVNDEAARLDALRDLAVLDTPPEPGLDELVQFARRRFGMPIALISLVDEARQWFKARSGLDVCERRGTFPSAITRSGRRT